VSSLRPASGTASEVLALLRAWDAADDPEPLIIETSGSTGRPKRVALSRDAMRASASATLERLGGPGQWVLNLPPTYVAGVQVLFRSVMAGTEPVVQTSELSDAVLEMAGGRRYVSLVPTQLVRLLDNGYQTGALGRFDAVLIGGGPLSPTVRAEAERARVRIVQTYGMSETCGGCVYDGIPLDGVEMRIKDDQVQLRGPILFDGYDGEPERTAAAFDDTWLITNDLGRLTHDGRLQVLGRADDVIISGGVKVPAYAVQQMLEQHPRIFSAAVVGVPDAEWGERVVAVLDADDPPPLDELRDLVTPREWAPRAMLKVDEIPLLSNGKVDRATLKELAAHG
jgi:O-succinylbenzoic acid--CoA ligase